MVNINIIIILLFMNKIALETCRAFNHQFIRHLKFLFNNSKQNFKFIKNFCTFENFSCDFYLLLVLNTLLFCKTW